MIAIMMTGKYTSGQDQRLVVDHLEISGRGKTPFIFQPRSGLDFCTTFNEAWPNTDTARRSRERPVHSLPSYDDTFHRLLADGGSFYFRILHVCGELGGYIQLCEVVQRTTIDRRSLGISDTKFSSTTNCFPL